MFRHPSDEVQHAPSSDDGGVIDLQSLLERIDLQGSRHEQTAVDEVAENLRARLNIRVDDNDIFQALASQLLGVSISGSPVNKNDQNVVDTSISNSPKKASPPPLEEAELQKTWSAESSSTNNSQPELASPPIVDTIAGSNSHSSSMSLEQTPSNESNEETRGRSRSPYRDIGNQNESATAIPTPTGRGSNRPPTSDGKSMRGSAANVTRRSPSPFRRGFSSIFSSRKGKDVYAEGTATTAASPSAAGTPLRTSRSFERSSPVTGIKTPSRPPMSPYPPSSEGSFGSSIPPTPHTPFSIVGLASPGDLSTSVEFSTPLSSTPAREQPPASNQQPERMAAATSPKPTSPQAQQTMDHEMFSAAKRGRGRARTPSRSNPRVQTPPQSSQSRSQSLPRTNSRTSPFRNLSPGRFFKRFASPSRAAKAAATEQTAKPINRDYQPMQEDASLCPAGVWTGVTSPAPIANAMPADHVPQATVEASSLPKSSPLKTPASRMGNTDKDCKTGKNKLRRKMTNPLDGTLSPASAGSADESLDSLDGELPAHPAFPAMFNVNLAKGPKSQQLPRGKRTGAIRRSTAPPMASQPPPSVANSPPKVATAAATTPRPSIYTNFGTTGPTPALTPMDTDYSTNANAGSGAFADGSGLVPPGVAMGGPAGVQFSIGGAGRRHSKRGPRVRAQQRPTFNQPTVGNIPVAVSSPTKQQTAPAAGGMQYQPNAMPMPNPTSAGAQQTSNEQAQIQGRIGNMREEARRFHQAGDYASSIKFFTDAIHLHGGLDPRTTPGDMLALLLSNRAAGLLMVRAVSASIQDCEVALGHVSPMTPPHFTLSSDRGPVLKAKLYTRMARALLKKGHTKMAEGALQNAITTAESAMTTSNRVHNQAEVARNRGILSHIIGEATLEFQEVKKFQVLLSKLGVRPLPTLKTCGSSNLNDRLWYVEALSHVNNALSTAPCCLELHEKKVSLLICLKRWREVANHCERMAAASVWLDIIPGLAVDSVSMNIFQGVPPATSLTANVFRRDIATEDFKITDYDSACMKLGTTAAAEAILRMPQSFQATYCRALRLEERYPPAEAALKALERFVRAKARAPEHSQLYVKFSWLAGEVSKLQRAKESRERADGFFRGGEFELAFDHYGRCLRIDSEGVAAAPMSGGTAGGRLHAVLHCNRAACLMSLKKHEEAIKECSSALRIHNRYLKALLRRSRCYARLKKFVEAMNDQLKWLELVDEERQSPDSFAAYNTACLFDGPRSVKDDDITTVRSELAGIQQEKARTENNARNDASYRQERQNFQAAHQRRDHFYNQQGPGNSRRWDSFNDGPGSKRSPKQKNKPQSNNRPDSRRGSQNSGYANRAPNPASAVGTHYGILAIAMGATASEIKKAYRKAALKFHPDKNSDPNAPEQFRKVKAAFDVLNSPASKRKYDHELRLGGGRRL